MPVLQWHHPTYNMLPYIRNRSIPTDIHSSDEQLIHKSVHGALMLYIWLLGLRDWIFHGCGSNDHLSGKTLQTLKKKSVTVDWDGKIFSKSGRVSPSTVGQPSSIFASVTQTVKFDSNPWKIIWVYLWRKVLKIISYSDNFSSGFFLCILTSISVIKLKGVYLSTNICCPWNVPQRHKSRLTSINTGPLSEG